MNEKTYHDYIKRIKKHMKNEHNIILTDKMIRETLKYVLNNMGQAIQMNKEVVIYRYFNIKRRPLVSKVAPKKYFIPSLGSKFFTLSNIPLNKRYNK